MPTKKILFTGLMTLASTGIFASAYAADPEPARSGPITTVSTSNFIKAESIPWQSVCEWTDETGKAHAVWTVGLDRPGPDIVPATVLCVKVKRFIFSNGRGFSESHFQKDRSTALQQGHTSNLMYILAGRGQNMVDNQIMDSTPGDALIQVAEKVHRNAAVGEGYVQIATNLPNVGPGEGIQVSDADLARPNLAKHDEAPKSEICIFADEKGAFKSIRRGTGNDAGIPAKASCVTLYSLIARPNGTMAEVRTPKGTKTPARTEPLDKLIYVVKGRVRTTIGAETEEMKAGDALFQPADMIHANEFLEDTTEVEIKLPKVSKAPAAATP